MSLQLSLPSYATQWKYSNILQLISSLSKLEKTEVTQQRGQEIITLQCPTDITKNQQNMNGADRGEKLLQHSAGFPAQSHFKR